MSKNITIHVTHQNIGSGQVGGIKSCPIAQAIEDALPGSFPEVWFTTAEIYLAPKFNKAVTIALPPEAITFRRDYDNYQPVRPFNFSIEVPDV